MQSVYNARTRVSRGFADLATYYPEPPSNSSGFRTNAGPTHAYLISRASTPLPWMRDLSWLPQQVREPQPRAAIDFKEFQDNRMAHSMPQGTGY